MNIHFFKYHGSGNDFVIIDQLSTNSTLSKSHEKELSIKLSDRKGVIGSDGLLFVKKPTNINYDAKMTVYTPDGSEIPMCVNGIRCVGRFVLEQKPNLKIAKIETNSGLVEVKKDGKLLNIIDSYTVSPIEPIYIENISPRIYSKKSTVIDEYIKELSLDYKFSIVSVHTPYAVCIVDKIDENVLYEIGEKANSLKKVFPNGLNISFVKIIDSYNIYVRTYERNNIGLSLSCASAMISSVFTLCHLGQLNYGDSINIFNKGGLVRCICDSSSAQLSGNSTYVYVGDIDYDFSDSKISKVFNGNFNLNESMEYSTFLDKTKELCDENSFLIERTAK